MLRFFRTIRQRLINDSKVKKYGFYAFGEVLLVVVGILIALQINNWNEERKVRLEEQALLVRLNSEFTQNQEQLEIQIEYYEWILELMDRLLAAMEPEPDLMPQEDFEEAFTRISWIPRYTPFDGTINSIISSGKIGIISNNELNRLITNWPGTLENLSYLYQILYDLSKNQNLNYFINKYPFRNGEIDMGSGSSGRSAFSYDQFALLSSLEMENIVELKRVDSEYLFIILKDLHQSQSQMLALIQSELEKLD